MTEKRLTINELRAGTKSSRALRIGGAAVLIAAVAAGVWYFGLADTAKVPVYRTVEITLGPLEVTVVANGTVNPVRTVSIGSELSGIVRKVNVDVNSIVKAGDVLIELDDSNLKANVNQAKASLASAKASLAEAQATLVEAEAKMRRYEELNKSSGGRLPSRTELDVQRATVLKAKAGVHFCAVGSWGSFFRDLISWRERRLWKTWNCLFCTEVCRLPNAMNLHALRLIAWAFCSGRTILRQNSRAVSNSAWPLHEPSSPNRFC